MLAFLIQHQFWVAVILYWVLSAAVSAMPDPGPGAAPGYSWLFRFLHTVAGNITTAFANKLAGAKALFLLIAVPLVISTSACAAAHYTLHPGALNPLDSTTYDTLLVAESTIDDARDSYQTGGLPDNTRPAFDTLLRSYNLARQSWLAYRGAIATQVPEAVYFNQLKQNLTDLANALCAFLQSDAGRKDAR